MAEEQKPPQLLCAVHNQGAFTETAPGIRVRTRSRPCGKAAAFWGTWNDQVQSSQSAYERTGLLVETVQQRTLACQVHHDEIETGKLPLVDSLGVQVDVEWEPIETEETPDGDQ